MERGGGILGTIAQGDDRHDRFPFRDIENGAESIGVTRPHDQGVETHCPGFQDQESVAQTVVVSTPSVANLIGWIAPEEAALRGQVAVMVSALSALKK